jgi:hypothetical protein
MSKRRIALIFLFLLVVLGSGALVGLFISRILSSRSNPTIYNTATLLKQIQTLSQLVTVKYVIEKVEILEDKSQNPIRAALPDDTRVILVAHGIVKAGIDFERLKPGDLQLEGKKVRLVLPPAQITDTYLDDRQTKVIERNTSFFREFNKDLEQTARQNAVDDIRRAARTSGILKDADERARAQLKGFFDQLGLQVEIVPK